MAKINLRSARVVRYGNTSPVNLSLSGDLQTLLRTQFEPGGLSVVVEIATLLGLMVLAENDKEHYSAVAVLAPYVRGGVIDASSLRLSPRLVELVPLLKGGTK